MEILCLEFVNSEFRDFRGRWVKDQLQDPEWVEQFLGRWDLHPEVPGDPLPLTALFDLRGVLRQLVETLATRQLLHEDLTELNSYMRAASVNLQLVRKDRQYLLEQTPIRKDWSWVLAKIATSFAEMLVTYEPRRLKICENSSCRGIFYDESKSQTQRFCTSTKCANLVKMRRFRARHKQGRQSMSTMGEK
jgi:predicted RNA-binding Zn ribbon-like protein